MKWRELSNKLVVEQVNRMHECALVLDIEQELASHVRSERDRLMAGLDMRHQLDPHITVFFGGIQSPDALLVLARLAKDFESEELDFSIDGMGAFRDQGGTVKNIHFRVSSPRLQSMHEEVMSRFVNLGMSLPTPYIGERYSAHVSVFDRIEVPAPMAGMLKLPALDRHFWAGGCQLIGEPREGL